jgi:hypothetical protein
MLLLCLGQHQDLMRPRPLTPPQVFGFLQCHHSILDPPTALQCAVVGTVRSTVMLLTSVHAVLVPPDV